MSKGISAYFLSKRKSSELPPNVSDYLKSKLAEKSKENVNVVENDSNSKIELDVAHLQIKLEEANKKIEHLNGTIVQQNEDIKLLKRALKISNQLCVSKDVKIERLLKEKSKCVVGKSQSKPVMFKNFESRVDSSMLKQLRNIPPGQKQDSTFILMMVRYLYREDRSILCDRTVSGKGKTPITPTKKRVMDEMLKERVVAEEDDEFRVLHRTNRIGSLISDAIYNITRPLKRVIIKF